MELSANIKSSDLERIKKQYGEELTKKIVKVTEKYNSLIQREAKSIIKNKGAVDTGRLLNSVKSSVKTYGGKVKGEVSADAKYSKFVHDGTKNTKPFFVPFRVAPSLLDWAIRHGKIKRRKKGYSFISSSGKEYSIGKNLKKSGMLVFHKGIKFIEKPFQEYKDEYVKEFTRLLK